MDKQLTEILVVADRSGSMRNVMDDTIGGFNTFLVEQQKSVSGRCLITYCQFDDRFEVVHESLPIEQMVPLNHETFVPRGSTALLDAVGRTIDEAGKRFALMPEDKRPGNVVVVIMTDGGENSSSSQYKRGKLQEMVKRQADVYLWTFIFLGQNIDAFAQGHALGLDNNNEHMFVGNVGAGGKGQQAAYCMASVAVAGTRDKVSRGVSKGFMSQERVAYTRALDGDDSALNGLDSAQIQDSTDSSSGSSSSDSQGE